MPSDSLHLKVVIVLPKVTNSQLNGLITEFEKYEQIKKAVFVLHNHNCLLIDVVPDRKMVFYGDLIKVIHSNCTPEDVFIKIPLAYDEIMSLEIKAENLILIK